MYMVRQGDVKYIYHAPLLSGERFGLHVCMFHRVALKTQKPPQTQRFLNTGSPEP